jgi:hypothetical protein
LSQKPLGFFSYVINVMNSIREHVISKFANVLNVSEDHAVPINMEKSIYNWSIRQSKKVRDVPSWESRTFKNRYKLRFCSIVFNISNSEEFKKNILDGCIKSNTIAHMTSTGMQPDGIQAREIQKRTAYHNKRLQVTQEEIVGMFTCGKCKSKRTTYYQMQTRSADEPMTTFVTCLNCDKRWKC